MATLVICAVASTATALIGAISGANYYIFGFSCAVAGYCVGLAYAAATTA